MRIASTVSVCWQIPFRIPDVSSVRHASPIATASAQSDHRCNRTIRRQRSHCRTTRDARTRWRRLPAPCRLLDTYRCAPALRLAHRHTAGTHIPLTLPADITHCAPVQEYFPAELAPSVVDPLRVVLAGLRARGATLVPVSLPSTPLALSAYYVLASAEASSCLARYDGVQYGAHSPSRFFVPFIADANERLPSQACASRRRQGQTRAARPTYTHTPAPPGSAPKSGSAFSLARMRSPPSRYLRTPSPIVFVYAEGLAAYSAFDNYFLKAQRLRERVRRDFDRVFAVPNVLRGPDAEGAPEGVDVLLHPSAIRTAPPLPAGPASPEVKGQEDGLGAYTQDVLTVPASLAGLPALSVPVGSGADGWPVGGALVGQWGCEALVLRVGEAVEGVVADRAR